MSSCAGQKKAIVYFEYTGENERSVTSYSPPVSFTTETVESGGNTETNRYKLEYYRSDNEGNIREDFGAYTTVYWRSGVIGQAYIKYRTSTRATFNPFQTGLIIDLGSFKDGNHIWVDSSTEGQVRWTFRDFRTWKIQIVGVIAESTEQTTSECKLEISDSTGIIYTETRDECPQVRIECGKECPPNSCECTHGGHRCCFDSTTGKLIKVIKL